MRATSKLLALALTAAMQPSMAGVVLLDFEDIQTSELLNKVYNGVSVGGAAWTATSEACSYSGQPGDVSFVRAGSCGALWLAADPTQPATNTTKSLTLGLSDGFDGFSFVYSGSVASPGLEVHAYDAAGQELGVGLKDLTAAVCGGYVFCNWSQPVSLTFTGVAHSVTFSAADQTILLDDLRFNTPGNTNPPGRLPEPASLALALGALGVAGWTRKRAAR